MEKKLTGYPSIDKPWLKYYPAGADSIPVPKKSAYQFIYDKQKENGNNIALKYLGSKISYKKLFEKIAECAKALKAFGVQKGDIVTLALPTSPETVYLFYALNRMKGYYNNTDATNELIRIHKDGKRWVHTGDLGIMNENGNLFIKGRMKRLIVRSVNKIFPQTIESIIIGHKNVINCAVVHMYLLHL